MRSSTVPAAPVGSHFPGVRVIPANSGHAGVVSAGDDSALEVVHRGTPEDLGRFDTVIAFAHACSPRARGREHEQPADANDEREHAERYAGAIGEWSQRK